MRHLTVRLAPGGTVKTGFAPVKRGYRAGTEATVGSDSRFLLPEDVERAVSENVGLYDCIIAHAPDGQSCHYLFAN